ncbi:putative translation elongation factor eEF-3, partial [Corchorus olitorius]
NAKVAARLMQLECLEIELNEMYNKQYPILANPTSEELNVRFMDFLIRIGEKKEHYIEILSHKADFIAFAERVYSKKGNLLREWNEMRKKIDALDPACAASQTMLEREDSGES